MNTEHRTNPHRDGPVRTYGTPLAEANGAVVLLHGRGGSAQQILSLAPELLVHGVSYLAPQAADSTWYPYSFLASRNQNEPYLSSALSKVETVVKSIEAAGIARDRIVIGGFSQGACLASEFVASHPARYAGLLAFTGGLVGPPGAPVTGEELTAGLDGMPAFLGSGDPDPHVPWARVEQTAAVLERMGAKVVARRYPGRPHTISQEELQIAQEMLGSIFSA